MKYTKLENACDAVLSELVDFTNLADWERLSNGERKAIIQLNNRLRSILSNLLIQLYDKKDLK